MNMKRFTYLFIKFILIYNCVCVENEISEIYADPPSLGMFSQNDSHRKLILIDKLKNNNINNLFLRTIADKVPGADVTKMAEICPGGVNSTIKAFKLFRNSEIVNLGVVDFYKYNYNYILRNGLYYGGDIGDSIETFPSYVIDMKGCDKNTGNIEVRNQTLRHVKLFSKRGILDPSVYDNIYNFQENSTHNNKSTVLICLYHNIDNIYQIQNKFHLKLVFTGTCERVMGNITDLLAVITLTPFERDDIMPIPIILYSTPITNLKSFSYKYLTALTSSYAIEVFKSALLQFMKNVRWQRIAILSDNYDHSVEFERSLVSTFDKEAVMYAVFRCEENLKGDYNFSEALNTLKNADARIIILNMEEKNIKRLSDEMRNHPPFPYNPVWILRHQTHDRYDLISDTVLSINLAPTTTDIDFSKKVDSFEKSPINNIVIKAIYECVTRVQQAYDSVETAKNIHDDNHLLHDYRKFNEILRSKSNTKTQVYITYQRDYSKPKLLASMLFDGVQIITEYYDTESKSMPPDIGECLVRSRNFFKPCNFFELIYFMFVLVVFFPILFTVVIFFTNKNTIHEGRSYRNL